MPSWLGLPSLEEDDEGNTRATFFRLGKYGLAMDIAPPQDETSRGEGLGPGAIRAAPEPTTLPSEAELEAMTVKELKRFLESHIRVSTAGCLEKTELLALAKAGRTRALQAAAPEGSAPTW